VKKGGEGQVKTVNNFLGILQVPKTQKGGGRDKDSSWKGKPHSPGPEDKKEGKEMGVSCLAKWFETPQEIK